MDVRYINPFLVAVRNVFDTMVQVPIRLGKPAVKSENVPLHEVSGIIGLSGHVNGCVVLNMSEAIVFELVSALTGEPVDTVDADCTDAIGEIANMIAGSAKKDFPGEDTSISIPSVIIGRHKVAYPQSVAIISIPCDTRAGRLCIDVALKVSSVPAPA